MLVGAWDGADRHSLDSLFGPYSAKFFGCFNLLSCHYHLDFLLSKRYAIEKCSAHSINKRTWNSGQKHIYCSRQRSLVRCVTYLALRRSSEMFRSIAATVSAVVRWLGTCRQWFAAAIRWAAEAAARNVFPALVCVGQPLKHSIDFVHLWHNFSLTTL